MEDFVGDQEGGEPMRGVIDEGLVERIAYQMRERLEKFELRERGRLIGFPSAAGPAMRVQDLGRSNLSLDSPWRHWYAKSPNGGGYWFEVVSLPNRLIVTGDIGDWILTNHCADMLSWSSRVMGRLFVESKGSKAQMVDWGYLAEKLTACGRDEPLQFHEDLASQWADEMSEEFTRSQEAVYLTPRQAVDAWADDEFGFQSPDTFAQAVDHYAPDFVCELPTLYRWSPGLITLGCCLWWFTSHPDIQPLIGSES